MFIRKRSPLEGWENRAMGNGQWAMGIKENKKELLKILHSPSSPPLSPLPRSKHEKRILSNTGTRSFTEKKKWKFYLLIPHF
jgi:hypothetical protein